MPDVLPSVYPFPSLELNVIDELEAIDVWAEWEVKGSSKDIEMALSRGVDLLTSSSTGLRLMTVLSILCLENPAVSRFCDIWGSCMVQYRGCAVKGLLILRAMLAMNFYATECFVLVTQLQCQQARVN
jgi:hypothetical protein